MDTDVRMPSNPIAAAFNEITSFSQRISAFSGAKKRARLARQDGDAGWNVDFRERARARERDRSHIRPALPNHKSISDAGINYQTKAAVAY